jgi:predicted ArsR family transcriptional regulator
MHRCPFHDLAESAPEVVCAVHKGLIDGALEELGSDLRVDRLDVFVEPDVCVARLKASIARRPS